MFSDEGAATSNSNQVPSRQATPAAASKKGTARLQGTTMNAQSFTAHAGLPRFDRRALEAMWEIDAHTRNL
jgi:hypothetical protein